MPPIPPPLAVRPLSVFIVENHDDTRELLTMYLEDQGHMVRSAMTVAGALEQLATAGCDVLLSDIGLPDGDGWELLRRLPEPKPAYSVAMSGFGMGADHYKSKQAGFHLHLLKPFKPQEISEALAEAARRLAAQDAR